MLGKPFDLHFISGFPVVNDPLYNHEVFGAEKGKGGRIGKSDEQLIQDLRVKGCSSDLGGASESDGAYEDDVKGRFTIHIEFYTSLIIACSLV